MRVKEVLAWIDEYAPFRYAESWDRSGLQVGDPGAAIERVLVALDPCSATFDEAERLSCGCIVTHHPLIFAPLDSVRFDRYPERLVARAIRNEIHLVAAHTNLDVALDGTNFQLMRLLGLEDAEPLDLDSRLLGENRYGGLGCVGNLGVPVRFEDLVDKVGSVLGCAEVRVVGHPDRQLRRIALCTGSGGGLVERVIAQGVDAYITGDVKYHEARFAEESNLAVIDVGHFSSERIVVKPLAAYLEKRAAREGAALQVFAGLVETDPFRVQVVRSRRSGS